MSRTPHSASAHRTRTERAVASSPADAPRKTRLLVLDALRGAAALVVVLHHAQTLFPALFRRLHELSPALHALAFFVGRRNVEAVWAFFVLSGFSIRLSIEGRALDEPLALRHYLKRRARRILPPYWIALAVSWLVARTVAPAPAEATGVGTLLGNLFFLQTASGVRGQWFVPYAANGPLWSLSFEVFYYLAYPALVLMTHAKHDLALRRRRIAYVIAGSIVGLLLNLVSPSPLTLFLSASFVWYAGVELADRWLGHPPTVSRPIALLVLAVLSLLRFACGWLELHGSMLAFFALCIAPPAQSRGDEPEPATLRFFAWLGGVSYTLYLLHVPIMRAAVAIGGQGMLVLACSVGAALLAAWTTERAAQRISY